MTVLHVVPKFNADNGDTYTASFFVDTDPAVNTADQVEVAAALTDWLQDMYDLYAPYVNAALTAVEYLVYIHDVATGTDTPWFTGGWTFTGTDVGESLPPQASPTVSAYLSGAARPAQKRLPATTEARQDTGILTAGTLAALVNYAAEWMNGPTATATYSYTPGIPSTQNGVVQFRDLSGIAFVRSIMGTVATRKPGVGI